MEEFRIKWEELIANKITGKVRNIMDRRTIDLPEVVTIVIKLYKQETEKQKGIKE